MSVESQRTELSSSRSTISPPTTPNPLSLSIFRYLFEASRIFLHCQRCQGEEESLAWSTVPQDRAMGCGIVAAQNGNDDDDDALLFACGDLLGFWEGTIGIDTCRNGDGGFTC